PRPRKSSVDKTCRYGKRKKARHAFNGGNYIRSVTYWVHSSITHCGKCFCTKKIKLFIQLPAGLGDHPGEFRGADSEINNCIDKVDGNVKNKNRGNEFP